MATIVADLIDTFDVTISYAIGSGSFDSSVSFQVRVINPCVGIQPVPSSLSDHTYKISQIYKINAPAKMYTFVAFGMTPSFCTLMYSFTLAPAVGV